jgi:cobalt-zinc-cadmium efflux system outer membrane protein
MKRLIIFLAVLFGTAYGNSPCETFETPDDVLKCVVNNHAAIQVWQGEVDEKREGINAARQSPNPILEFEGLSRNNSDYSSSLTFMHTFELGDKKEARIRVAEKERDLSMVALLAGQEQLYVQTVTDLYRMRQIGHELMVVGEIILTLKKITDQYSNAGPLNPEDMISISVFSMAREENKLKRSSLINEKEEITARIESGLGRKISFKRNLLPQIKRSWPAIQDGQIAGSEILKARSNLELANANYSYEKSLSWSDLSIGPKVEIDKSTKTETRFGIALNIPLPLYHTNDGGKARSLLGVKKSKLQLNYTKNRVNRQNQYHKSVYNRVSKAIAVALSHYQISLKHKDVHSMLKRGVVSAPIVIELHRQIMGYYEKLHELEIKGVNALWNIAATEGRILQETLK